MLFTKNCLSLLPFTIYFMEEIKPIEGYPGYEISSDGYVYYMGNKKPQTDTCNPLSYKMVTLISKNRKQTISLHRLVAYYFVPNPENKPCVNHKDLDKMNCRADNLEWVTHSENTKHWREEYKKENEIIFRKFYGNEMYEAIFNMHL